MFKKVEYTGFEHEPDARIKAQQLTQVLVSEIRRWREDVEVSWSPDPVNPATTLNLSLSLTLPNGVSGSASGTFSPKDFSEDWLLRWRCGEIWSDLLDELFDKQDKRVKEAIFDIAEA